VNSIEAKNFSESLAPNQFKPHKARFPKTVRSAKFWEHDTSSASEKKFPGAQVLVMFFCCWTPSKKEVFKHTRIHSLLDNRCCLSVASRAVTCPLKQSNLSAWSLLSWHSTHTHLWVRLSVFAKLFVLHRHSHAEWLRLCQYSCDYSVTCNDVRCFW